MELCGNLTQSLCDYVRESQQRPFKTASDPHAANKVLLFKVVVNWNRIAHRQWRPNFPNIGRKPIYEKKKTKATNSVALVMAFLAISIAANNNLPFPVSCAGYKEKFANF